MRWASTKRLTLQSAGWLGISENFEEPRQPATIKEDKMSVFQGILLVILIVFTLVGYKLISQVPSLLHTPLMSGMNAFSGVTILGCLSATGAAVAISLAMVNIVGGFGVTDRMLRMFDKKKPAGEAK